MPAHHPQERYHAKIRSSGRWLTASRYVVPPAVSLLPMNKILIIAHAPFAQALRACALHVFPECAQQVRALDVPADEPCAKTFEAACALAPGKGEGDLLVLTDVFGATPSNVAQGLLQHCAEKGVRVREVTGVNLPMLLRAICYASLPLDDLEQCALTGGQQGMFAVDIATGAPVCTLLPAIAGSTESS